MIVCVLLGLWVGLQTESQTHQAWGFLTAWIVGGVAAVPAIVLLIAAAITKRRRMAIGALWIVAGFLAGWVLSVAL